MNAALPGAAVLFVIGGAVWWFCEWMSNANHIRQPRKCVTVHCICSEDVCRAFLHHEARPAWYREFLLGYKQLWLSRA